MTIIFDTFWLILNTSCLGLLIFVIIGLIKFLKLNKKGNK